MSGSGPPLQAHIGRRIFLRTDFVSLAGWGILLPMAVENRIAKVQKRNRALVRFDETRIRRAILRAAESIGGFAEDRVPGLTDWVFDACGSDERLAGFLADAVVVCLNSDPHHLISNFPPTIETIQDEVLHALRSYGFQNTADAYACYRWGRHWLREGAISVERFVGNGADVALAEQVAERNRRSGCDTVAGLNELVRRDALKSVIDDSIAAYEDSLTVAASEILSRVQANRDFRMIWITGPSSSGKTTTTVKLKERLERTGLRFLMLNLDDYFWSLVEHPTDWINDRNYETPEAIDIQLLNEHLRALLEGQTIRKPSYSFKEGRRVASKPVSLEPGQILLLDCLHGLYPPITEGIDASAQYRLYIHNVDEPCEGDGTARRRTKSTDIRLLRRVLRDSRHRNHSPLLTLLHWHYVRSGELFSIIPLRGLADRVINGGFPFELAVLKPFLCGAGGCLPSAADLEPYPGFLDARLRFRRVAALLESVEPMSLEQIDRLIPGDALVREFIGGSTVRIPHNE